MVPCTNRPISMKESIRKSINCAKSQLTISEPIDPKIDDKDNNVINNTGRNNRNQNNKV